MADEFGDGGLFDVDLGQRADAHLARPKPPGGQDVRLFGPDQELLSPPSLDDWLPAEHWARFIAELVDEHLDLVPIRSAYTEGRGAPPYDPRPMVRILLYGYTIGVRSSRLIEPKCVDDVPFRSLDGTRVRANLFPEEVSAALLADAERIDQAEDVTLGTNSRGGELPEQLRRRQIRLAKIHAAKAALEAEVGQRARKRTARWPRGRGDDTAAGEGAATMKSRVIDVVRENGAHHGVWAGRNLGRESFRGRWSRGRLSA